MYGVRHRVRLLRPSQPLKRPLQILLLGILAAQRIPLPVGHRQQRPPRRPQLPPLERRRACGRAPEKVRRTVHLHRHLAPAVRNHRVQTVTLRRAHLLLRRQPQRAERCGHVALQPRRHALLLAKGGAAALGELGRQRRPGGAALLLPQLPLASPPKSAGAGRLATAKAHAVLQSSCRLNWRSPRCAASLAIASSSAGAAWPSVANAHAVLARACGLKSRSLGAASLAIASSSAGAV
eukprot:scaffold18492_cov72-Phaeocystis_antarctica.AAC.2